MSVGDRNAMTTAFVERLEEGRLISLPQVLRVVINRHHIGPFRAFGNLLNDASGYNGKKNAYRRQSCRRNARGSGRWK